MNAQEELTELLMESYDRGVEDAKQEALAALELTVAVMVAAEREACAKLCKETDDGTPYNLAEECAAAIRARSNT